MKYVFYDTEGHGYLEVTYDEIVDLGIEEDITESSYISPKRDKVYLEEDYDLGLFLKKKKVDFDDLSYRIKYVDSSYFDVEGLDYPFYS